MKRWMGTVTLAAMSALLFGCGSVPRQINPFVSQPLYSQAQYAVLRLRAIERSVVVDADTGQPTFVGVTEYVILSDFQFSPDRIVLKSGAITRVRVSNSAWVTHYFGGGETFDLGVEMVSLLGSDIPSEQQHIPVPPFTERDIYLFAKDPGEYLFSCFVPSHRKEGMEGVLVVEAVDTPAVK